MIRIVRRGEAQPYDEKAVRAEQVREATLAAVRDQRDWREVDITKFVRRGPRNRWLVDPDDDSVWVISRTDPRMVLGSPDPQVFFVDGAGNVCLLEPLKKKWSEVYERNARAEAAGRRLRAVK